MSSKEKVIVVITAIEKDGYDLKEYSSPCIQSWKNWCKIHNIPLITMVGDEFIHPKFAFLSIFEKFNADKIVHVDVDTIIHPQTPNLFDLYEDKLTVVKDCGLHDGVISPRMSKGVDKFEKVFSEFNLNKDNFFNSGVMMFHRNHKKLLKECKDWVTDNFKSISEWSQQDGPGLDQIPFNWFVQKNKIDLQFLDLRFNRTNLLRKKLNVDDNYIIHFRGIKDKNKINEIKHIYSKLW